MGITLDHYRASIGSFNVLKRKQKGFKKTNESESSDQCPPTNHQHSTNKPKCYGPWKLAKMLVFTLIIILSLPVPLLASSTPSTTSLLLPSHQSNETEMECMNMQSTYSNEFYDPSETELALPDEDAKHLPQVTNFSYMYEHPSQTLHPKYFSVSPVPQNLLDALPIQTTTLPYQCHRLLLLISGIESHPGPTPEDIMADLCTNAPTTEVRDCLRTYILNSADLDALHKHIVSKNNRSSLESTLNYLLNPMLTDIKPEDYTVKGLAYQLIYRIENLLPETCTHCSEEYCHHITDIPLLACSVCGQGAHTPCVFRTLLVEEDERANFTPEMASKKINPLMIPELKYLCKDCAEDYLPDKKDGLKKSVEKQRARTESVSHVHIRETTPETEDATEDATHAEAGTQENRPAVQQDTARGLFPQTNRSGPPINGPPGHNSPNGILNSPSNENPPPNSNPPSNDICSYYLKGTCRYGISGRLCPKQHPKACKKLLQNGNKSPNGCTLGRNCEKHHPPMCASSLRMRICYNQDCKLVHVKGTKRIRQQSNNPAQTPAHIPRLLDLRPNQQQNPTHDRQQHNVTHDRRQPAQLHQNHNHNHPYYQSHQDYAHDQSHTAPPHPNNTQQYHHRSQNDEVDRTNDHPTQPNQNSFLEEAVHSINSMKQEMRMQFQHMCQNPPQIQQILQKFRQELLDEMNQRLSPYPPLSRNNLQETYGEQANEGQYPGHRGETPRYNQSYRRDPHPVY